MKTYEIFWTGGFDSTLRVVQLSRFPIKIQPVYCTGVASDIRKSEFYELRAIKRISGLLREKSETKAEILPLKIVHTRKNRPQTIDSDFTYEALPHNHDVAKAFRRIYISMMTPRREQLATGRGVLNAVNLDLYIDSQYQWLAAYANSREQPVEIGITARYVNKFMEAVGGIGAVEEHDNGYFKQYVLNKEKCQTSDGYTIFGNFAFSFYNAPLKPELIAEYKRLGCEDVMNLTWFCYDPIDDEPCGQCWTCVHTYRDGITNRFSPAALERYFKREKELSISITPPPRLSKNSSDILKSEVKTQGDCLENSSNGRSHRSKFSYKFSGCSFCSLVSHIIHHHAAFFKNFNFEEFNIRRVA